MEIGTMEAGRELDALVAEHVRGLPVVWATPPYHNMRGFMADARYPWLKGTGPGGVNYDWAPVPHYSTDIADAWDVLTQVLGELRSRRERFYRCLQDEASLRLDGALVAWPDVLTVLRDRFPLAVCRAALHSVTLGQGPLPGVQNA